MVSIIPAFSYQAKWRFWNNNRLHRSGESNGESLAVLSRSQRNKKELKVKLRLEVSYASQGFQNGGGEGFPAP